MVAVVADIIGEMRLRRPAIVGQEFESSARS
jgi:hypothetical protein